jgi:hypothetical protein
MGCGSGFAAGAIGRASVFAVSSVMALLVLLLSFTNEVVYTVQRIQVALLDTDKVPRGETL